MKFITPEWSVHGRIHAVSTTRNGGRSKGRWQSLNLGNHVEDQPVNVEANRRLLCEALSLPAEPQWINQVHGNDVVYADGQPGEERTADAVWTDKPDVVLSIMTADCLPVLFASTSGECVAAAHAGWRGLASGILQKTVTRLPVAANELVAWLGPAIGPECFEVGKEVKQAFFKFDSSRKTAFKQSPTDPDKYFANLFVLARAALAEAGVKQVYGGGMCTFSDSEQFFSYRRDGGQTGRMASLVWMNE